MVRICLIQKELKDKHFNNGCEKVNFQIFKALCESDFFIDVYCVKNSLSKKYSTQNITELSENNFFENSYSIVQKLNYDLTFATDYFPSDIVYIHKHTVPYKEHTVQSKIEALYHALFHRREYNNSIKIFEKQKNYIQQNKIILTPSIIMKNDLINTLHANGQNVYILPPAIEIPKNVKLSTNKIMTFGFIGNDFMDKGGYILLKALKNLSEFDYKLKMIYPYPKIPKHISFYIKYHGLEDKIEFLNYQDDMNAFYNSIDCLLLPSKKESFGLSVLEAMSRGKIVVVSSRCGAKDIIEHDNNGLIFDVTNNPVRNFERILKYILINQNDFENMRQKAVYTASVYNMQKFKNELLRIIEKYVDKNTEE